MGLLEREFSLGSRLEKLLGVLHTFYTTYESVFRERQVNGFVRDVHGDLHTGNIFLSEKPILFDCIDYNDEYRFIDTLLDLAFLVMELKFLGRWDLASMLVESYGYHQTDPHLFLLLPFYKSLRANVFLILQARAFAETTDFSKRQEHRNHIFSSLSLSESYVRDV